MENLSISRINLYLQCGLKYEYQYINNIPKTFRPSYLAFESALHSTLSWLHNEMLYGYEVPLNKLYRMFDIDWYCKKMELPIRYKTGENEMFLVSRAKDLLHLYLKGFHNIVKGIRVPFRVPIVNPFTGEALEVSLEGFFELLETGNGIVEFTASSQSLSQRNVQSRLQLTIYGYAFEMLKGRPPDTLKVVNFIKARKPGIETFITRRSQYDYEALFYLAREILSGIEAKIFTPRVSFYCKDCEYIHICPMWNNKRHKGLSQK